MKPKIELILDKEPFAQLPEADMKRIAKVLRASVPNAKFIISSYFVKPKAAKKIAAELNLSLADILLGIYIRDGRDETIYAIEEDTDGIFHIQKFANYLTPPRYLEPGTKAEMQKNLSTILKEWRV